MDDYEMDETENSGLDSLSSEEEGEETANITDASARGALMFGGSDVQARYGEAVKKYESSTQEVLNQIAAARDRLLKQPTEQSRSDQLRGLAMALAAPRERDDPRFYERQNLYTFLRDIGEYGAAQKKAEKEAKLKQESDIAKLDELRAKYEQQSALGLMEKLGPAYRESIKPKQEPKDPERIRADRAEAEARGITLQKLYEQRDARQLLLAGRTGSGTGTDKYVNDFTILQDPSSSPAEKSAALARLPPDVRKNWQAAGKNDASYADRINQLQSFTIPDVKRAIEMIEANPNLSAGTLASFIKGTPVIGQKATDLDNTLSVIRSAVGFDKLEELKKLSPYGASGLGAVSNAEQKLLQSVKGSLEQDNSAKNLIYNLKRLQSFYEDYVPTIIAAQGIDLDLIRQNNRDMGTEPATPAGGTPALGISADAIRAERERRKKSGGR